ncbi:hypothetical protein CDD83_8936 [Cordyceps sp. RAO-2017]|nr:hypothetical protein CDD83_8936 [Cordyceps sp. RAO-2017]
MRLAAHSRLAVLPSDAPLSVLPCPSPPDSRFRSRRVAGPRRQSGRPREWMPRGRPGAEARRDASPSLHDACKTTPDVDGKEAIRVYLSTAPPPLFPRYPLQACMRGSMCPSVAPSRVSQDCRLWVRRRRAKPARPLSETTGAAHTQSCAAKAALGCTVVAVPRGHREAAQPGRADRGQK